MDRDAVILFFALLATAAQAVVVVAIVLAVGGRASATVARWRDAAREAVAPQALGLAAGVALVATLGSLYLSEVADFPPCRLCWFQRIAMYPLVVVLGVGAVRRDAGARLTGAILAGLGACVSIWHLLVERYPTLESGSCDPTNPCSTKWVEEWGYLTIPAMALSGFALILVLLAAARPTVSPEELA
ncbi:MAG: disulfide bond formation protein B [Acidimicrobiales bacterium]|nr:disulfide bond formation protein B [Acidimicrobiales bacterium]HRW36266.1 disulfide bond formation protein B [Aquihabitans sp.]